MRLKKSKNIGLFKKIGGIFTALAVYLGSNLNYSEALKIEIDDPIISCLDYKRNGKIEPLQAMKDMFKSVVLYIDSPEKKGIKSASCLLEVGKKFKDYFKDISYFSNSDNKEVFIKVHNYMRFLCILCRDIIIPIYKDPANSKEVHDKAYDILVETSQNAHNLLNHIERLYQINIDRIPNLPQSHRSILVMDEDDQSYCMYIEPIYWQLKSLCNLLRAYRITYL